MNLRAVLWLIGCVHLLLAAFLLVPAGVSIYYGEQEALTGCAIAVGASAIVGGVLAFLNRGSTKTEEGSIDFFRREGLAVVGLTWLVSGIVGAIPFMFCGESSLGAVDAFFEAVSGFTTTGSTILDRVAEPRVVDGQTLPPLFDLPMGILFWRSFTHWLGGIGIVLVFVVLFPTGGRSLFRSEVPGVAREAVQQRVRDSAIALMRVYVGLTVVQVGALLLCGERVFDAVVHSFGTLATGGFSPYANSIDAVGDWKVELVIVAFMLAAGINFAVYDSVLRHGIRRAWSIVRRSPEVHVYVGMIAVCTATIALALWFTGDAPPVDPGTGEPVPVATAGGEVRDYRGFGRCVRDASFAVVALQTSTGYGTANFDEWPQFCRVLLMFLAFVGACAGSTGGGLKVIRFLILARASIRGVAAFARPRAIHTVRLGGETLDESTVASVVGYCGLWLLVFAGGTLFVAAFGIDPEVAATSVIATLNNIGPGLGAIGPYGNFAAMPDVVKVVLALFMIVGRLEFYAVVVLFVPRFWRH